MVLDITTSLPTSSHVMFDLEILTKIVLTDIRFIICSQLQSHLLTQHLPSLKLTFLAPENGWLEDDPLLLGEAYFQGLLLLVSGRVLPPVAGHYRAGNLTGEKVKRRARKLLNCYSVGSHSWDYL